MPHAVQNIEVGLPQRKAYRNLKSKALPRELLQLTDRLLSLQELYAQSQLSQTLSRQFHTVSKSGRPITRIVSLGLGNLLVTKGQSRRLKQLTILLAIQHQIQEGQRESIEVYAQDPTFTRLDEAFLVSFGIQILRTSSGSDLGEAASVISPTTLVYSPFLTLEAYEKLLLSTATPVVPARRRLQCVAAEMAKMQRGADAGQGVAEAQTDRISEKSGDRRRILDSGGSDISVGGVRRSR